MREPRRGLYPGTFDPITKEHIDIIRRSLSVVDELVVAVAVNALKTPLFDLKERTEMVEAEIISLGGDAAERVKVLPFENLLTDFLDEVNATLVIRGLRAVSDFEYEFQMTGMNAAVNPNFETVFLMSSANNQCIASRFVKEIAKLGGKVDPFVSPKVEKQLKGKFL